MNNIRKIGLKFCGGCSPRYDRVGMVKRIKEELGGTIEFVSPDEPGTDFILAVMGCDAACANLDPFEANQIRTITSEKDTEALIKELKGEN
jgi:hypothetical protein